MSTKIKTLLLEQGLIEAPTPCQIKNNTIVFKHPEMLVMYTYRPSSKRLFRVLFDPPRKTWSPWPSSMNQWVRGKGHIGLSKTEAFEKILTNIKKYLELSKDIQETTAHIDPHVFVEDENDPFTSRSRQYLNACNTALDNRNLGRMDTHLIWCQYCRIMEWM